MSRKPKAPAAPGMIEKLSANEVFVFGSNAQGNHAGGAARTAVEKFGAVMGQGEGLQGQCYAIPTMDGLDALSDAVRRFTAFAREHSGRRFLLTPIGTGIAGHSAEDIGPLFAGAPANVILPPEFKPFAVLRTYKGFDKNLACNPDDNPFQYEVGKTYTHDGNVSACRTGFHACYHPLGVLSYYPLKDGNRYAEVEQSGTTDSDDNRKVASQTITIKAEIGIPGLIKAAVAWTRKEAGKAATSGDSAHSATSGNSAHSATSGEYANSATSGKHANSATSGKYANSATSGDSAHSATSGEYANSATSGEYANSATSGEYANSATSGDSAHSATSGEYANSATSGYSARVSTSAKGAVSANAGDGPAKAGVGGAIFIVERDSDRNVLAVFASKVGENGIKPDTWYVLRNGLPDEVSE